MTKARRPGDDILDHYLPGADEVTRERARERLRHLASIMLHVAMEEVEREARGTTSLN